MTRADALRWLSVAKWAAHDIGLGRAAIEAEHGEMMLAEGMRAGAIRTIGVMLRANTRRVAPILTGTQLRSRLTIAAILCAVEDE